ncbi:MAG: glycoside hydrolase family 97 protein [Prevotella sp.]|nr:glycoside hydrolase family 97 protein [Prevotella sp.]
MKKIFIIGLGLMLAFSTAQAQTVTSPNGKVAVILELIEGGQPCYRVLYEGQDVIERSALGLKTNIGDFTQGLVLKELTQKAVSDTYQLRNIKQSCVDYEATEGVAIYALKDKPEMQVMDIIFRVSDRDVAFRYRIQPQKETRVCVVTEEASSFALPEGTTSFLCPQSKPMGGFARTSPSYETPYTCDEPVGKNGWGEGYTFPCLFKTAQEQWVLISETGTDGGYVGCRLLNEQGGTYRIGFPQAGELNGAGATSAAVALPCETPWRTITVGPLANIAETTVAFDLVQPKYKASQEYVYGKGSWSWIIGMDPSCNFDEQKRYIDFSAAMGYQSVLIDAFWDQQIGYEKIAELARYGKEKGVGIFLWYNSNGAWNDAFQTPIGKMNNSRIRREEMRWMQENGIRGIKVDFFGGDKQPMMQLYEDILSDANDFGLLCIFHGCTLPRGWERMYPNYAASEAVLASENLHFGQGACDAEAYNACIHPFVRNTVGSMDFGGSALNKRYSADNQHGTTRRTSDVFALAVAVLFQSAVQHFALAPNNLDDAPAWAIDFMKSVPTTWEEVKFIDGYPGKYVILARKSGGRWYVVGINAEKETLKKTITLPMFAAGSTLQVYSDDAQLNGSVKTVKQNKRQQLSITIPCNGGIVVTE